MIKRTISNIWSLLTKPSAAIVDVGGYRNARLLSILSLVLIFAFLVFMVSSAINVENYRVPPADLVGYAVLFFIYFPAGRISTG